MMSYSARSTTAGSESIDGVIDAALVVVVAPEEIGPLLFPSRNEVAKLLKLRRARSRWTRQPHAHKGRTRRTP